MSQHSSHFCFADARRTDKEQGSHRLALVEQAGPGHQYGLRHLANGFVLAVNLRGKLSLERLEPFGISIAAHGQGINLANLGQHIGNVGLGNQ